MTQPEGDRDVVDLEFRPGNVLNAMGNFVQRHDHTVNNFGSVKDHLVEAALVHTSESVDKDPAHISALRAELLKLVEVEREVNAHKRALQELKQNYKPSLDRTAFKTQLEEDAKRHMGAASFNPASSEAVKEFDDNAGLEAEEPDSEDMDEDGVMLVGGDQNTHCPISGKDVMVLTDPVEDLKGYVYSREAITAYFKGRHRIPSPVAGTGHHITIAELKPAKKILKAQRRARLAGPSQGTQRPGEVVLEA